MAGYAGVQCFTGTTLLRDVGAHQIAPREFRFHQARCKTTKKLNVIA